MEDKFVDDNFDLWYELQAYKEVLEDAFELTRTKDTSLTFVLGMAAIGRYVAEQTHEKALYDLAESVYRIAESEICRRMSSVGETFTHTNTASPTEYKPNPCEQEVVEYKANPITIEDLFGRKTIIAGKPYITVKGEKL